MDQLKKTKVILDHLDEIMVAIEQTFLIEDVQQRRSMLKSILFYWLGIIYDDAFADRANLEIALATSQRMVEILREQNKVLNKRISQSR